MELASQIKIQISMHFRVINNVIFAVEKYPSKIGLNL